MKKKFRKVFNNKALLNIEIYFNYFKKFFYSLYLKKKKHIYIYIYKILLNYLLIEENIKYL
jgi:hypothetical protein